MTRSDAWKERDVVQKYRAWCDACRLAATGSIIGQVREDVIGIIAFFHFPVPESRKKEGLHGKLHRQTRDVDNCIKSVMDALLPEDKSVAFVQGYKLYVEEGQPPRTEVFLLVP